MAAIEQKIVEQILEQVRKLDPAQKQQVLDFAQRLAAYRLQVPLYTHNVRDFQPLLGSTLVLQPY